MCISHLFSEPNQWSLDFLELVDSACRSDCKPPISPITVAGGVTYLATASIIMPVRRLTLLKSLLFLQCIFPVRKSFFCKRWVCIRWSWHSALTKCFQVSMATSCISSLVMMQPLKSFKPCCLEWSFCWILTPEAFWNFLAALDYLIRLQRLDLESWVVSLSFPVCKLICCGWLQIIFISGLFLIRVVSLTTPSSVSLVQGFTHDNSVLYLFSTPQSRSQQLAN